MTEGKKNHFIKEMGNAPIYRKLEKVWGQVPQWEERNAKKITNFAYVEKGICDEEKHVIVSFGEIFT